MSSEVNISTSLSELHDVPNKVKIRIKTQLFICPFILLNLNFLKNGNGIINIVCVHIKMCHHANGLLSKSHKMKIFFGALCNEFRKVYCFRKLCYRSEEHTSELQSRPHLVC